MLKIKFKLCAILISILMAPIYSISQNMCGGVLDTNIGPQPLGIGGVSCQTDANSIYHSYYKYQQNHVPNANTANKKLQVNFVIWQKDDGSTNWQNTPAHLTRLNNIGNKVNEFYELWGNNPSDPMIPAANEIPDRKIAVDLANIVFMKNTNIAYGTKNWYLDSQDIINTFSIEHPEFNEYLNIHIMPRNVYGQAWGYVPNRGDRVIITSDDPANLGYNKGTLCLKDIHGEDSICPPISIAYNNSGGYYRDWSFIEHLSHEIGHNLNLCHVRSDQNTCIETVNPNNSDWLSDVFPMNATWCPSSSPCLHVNTGVPYNASTTDGYTNNIMESNGQMYCSPLQLGRMHSSLAFKNIATTACGYSETPLEITQNETWDFGMKLYSDVLVKAGNTLTIKCKLYMPLEGNILIEKGAKLVIDGGEITNSTACGESWQGILVYGNSSLPQNSTNQGVIEIKNQGTISHARTGITNAKYDANGNMVWGTTGGIIIADEANFNNNNRDVQLLAYHYFSPYGREMGYQASFTKCSFTRDEDYNMATATHAVTIWEVNGVSFNGCSFTNEDNLFTHQTDGIHALSSQIVVDRYHTLQNPLNLSCQFEGYKYAVRAENVCSGDRFSIISNSSFTNNLYAIYLAVHTGVRVTHNIIDVPGDIDPVPFLNPPYGVYFDFCPSFVFEENSITDLSNAASSQTLGAIFTNSGAASNVAYRNSFDGFTVATEANGSNRNTGNTEGLVFKCNRYGDDNQNTYDLYVNGNGAPGQGGIATNQGFYDPNISSSKDLANNLFSLNYQDIINDANANTFSYYFGTGDLRFDPSNTVNILENPTPTSINYAQDCLENLDGDGVGPIGTLGSIYSALKTRDNSRYNKRGLYTQLINGGNTPELEAEILLAGQPEYQQLYLELISISPYVDEGQLINLINNTGFAELALRNVLVANPHASRNPAIMEVLYNRTPAVSQQTIDDVLNTQQTITSKDVLESEMSVMNHDIGKNLLDLQYYYTTDNLYWDTDSLMNLLTSRKEAAWLFMLAETYWQRGQISSIAPLLANADATWWDEQDMATNMSLVQMYSTLVAAVNNGENKDHLSTATLAILQTQYSLETSPRAKRQLHGLLKSYNLHETSYLEPVFLPSSSSKTNAKSNRPQEATKGFKIYPNPAKDFVELQWNWYVAGLNGELSIFIYHANGVLKDKFTIQDYQKNIHLINTSGYVTGLYLIEVQNNKGEKLMSQKLSIVK